MPANFDRTHLEADEHEEVCRVYVHAHAQRVLDELVRNVYTSCDDKIIASRLPEARDLLRSVADDKRCRALVNTTSDINESCKHVQPKCTEGGKSQ